MRKGLLLIFLMFLGGISYSGNTADFSLQAGLGYDYFSQKYFIDSASNTDDSIFTSFILQNNYLDNLRATVGVSYAPQNGKSVIINGRYEYTDDFNRIKLSSDIYHKLNNTKLYFNGEIDRRARHNDNASGDSYTFLYSRGKIVTPFNDIFSFSGQLQAEVINFDSCCSFNYDYYRVGGKVGLEVLTDQFSFGEIKLIYMTRQVPDSSYLTYNDIGLESSFFGFHPYGDIDIITRLIKKNYDRPDNNNDYLNLDLRVTNKFNHTTTFFTSQLIEFELDDYKADDPIFRDYSELKINFLIGYMDPVWTIDAGPQIVWLNEKTDEFESSQDYFEYGLRADIDLFKTNLVLSSLESVTGIRNFSTDSEFYTDYSFQRFTYFGDLTIMTGLHLNCLISTEWEWHEIDSNDSQIYLLSSSLTYRF